MSSKSSDYESGNEYSGSFSNSDTSYTSSEQEIVEPKSTTISSSPLPPIPNFEGEMKHLIDILLAQQPKKSEIAFLSSSLRRELDFQESYDIAIKTSQSERLIKNQEKILTRSISIENRQGELRDMSERVRFLSLSVKTLEKDNEALSSEKQRVSVECEECKKKLNDIRSNSARTGERFRTVSVSFDALLNEAKAVEAKIEDSEVEVDKIVGNQLIKANEFGKKTEQYLLEASRLEVDSAKTLLGISELSIELEKSRAILQKRVKKVSKMKERGELYLKEAKEKLETLQEKMKNKRIEIEDVPSDIEYKISEARQIRDELVMKRAAMEELIYRKNKLRIQALRNKL